MPSKINQEEFVQIIKDKYGDEYTVLGQYINSKSKILIKHNKCGCEWEPAAGNFMGGHGCPKCAGNTKKSTETFEKEVHSLTNGEYKLIGQYEGNKVKTQILHIACGHEYSVTPHDFLDGNRCPKCNRNFKKTTKEFKKEVKDLVGKDYSVLGEYTGAKDYIRMKHNTCGYEYDVKPNEFLSHGRRCPLCANQVLKAGVNDLESCFPEIAQQFDKSKNIGILPNEIFKMTDKTFWWKCDKGHSWKAPVLSRTSHKNGCPYCSGFYAIPGETDLATRYPDIAKQWHPTKNINLVLEKTSPGYDEKVWWICDKGHEWMATPNSRTNKNLGCPICANKKVLEGFNDLATTHPYLLDEWDYEKNNELGIKPTEVTFGSRKRVFWKCKKCNNVWETEVCERQKYGCPACASSKGEAKIREVLTNNNISFAEQYKFNDCKHKLALSFDFIIYNSNGTIHSLIEYDGEQHFKAVKAWGGEEKLKETQLRDKIKDEYCVENDLELIRISYEDFDKIEDILAQIIQTIH